MTPTMTYDSIDRLGELLPFFEARRLGACPYCECVTAWLNPTEFGRHMLACVQITQGVEKTLAVAIPDALIHDVREGWSS